MSASLNAARAAPPVLSLRPRSSLHITTEVHGFVLYMASFVVFALYLMWALSSESVLHGFGITYYPDQSVTKLHFRGNRKLTKTKAIVQSTCFSLCRLVFALNLTLLSCRWWSVAMPAYFLMLLLFVPIFYYSWNMAHTLPLDDPRTFEDGWTRQHHRQKKLELEEMSRERQHRATQQHQQQTHPNSSMHPASQASSANDDGYRIEEFCDVPLARINRMLYQKRS